MKHKLQTPTRSLVLAVLTAGTLSLTQCVSPPGAYRGPHRNDDHDHGHDHDRGRHSNSMHHDNDHRDRDHDNDHDHDDDHGRKGNSSQWRSSSGYGGGSSSWQGNRPGDRSVYSH